MNNENHILTTTSNVSKKVASRSISDVVLKLNEEVGELSTEIGIKKGFIQNKTPGKDGITGEAIDAILCLIDIIYLDNPSLTPEEFDTIVNNKLNKWSNS
jgi:hypothetical protein